MPTHTQETLARVYAPTAAFLKAAGFRRNGRTLIRIGADTTDAIQFQASQWNTAESLSFTANLGVHQVELAKELHKEMPSLPRKVEDCMLQERIGFVLPDRRDLWWRIDQEHSEEAAAAGLREAVERWALPWYVQFRSREGLIQYLASQSGWLAADRLLRLSERALAIQVMEKVGGTRDGDEAVARWKAAHGDLVERGSPKEPHQP